MLVFALMAAIGTWAFDFDFVGAGPARSAFFLLGCFLYRADHRALVCALVLLFGTRAETSAWAAVNFMVMLAGIYYPVSVLPGWAQAVAKAIPLTYFLDAFRAGYGFEAAFAHPLAWAFRCPALRRARALGARRGDHPRRAAPAFSSSSRSDSHDRPAPSYALEIRGRHLGS